MDTPAPIPLRANSPVVVALRRDMHQYPELGFLEYRTAALAAQRLDALGYGLRVGPEAMRADAMLGRPSDAAVDQARRAALAAGAPAPWMDRMPGGQTAVVAEMRRGDGPVVALRFDMDALPVLETGAPGHAPNRDGYASRVPGAMHACGHDGHTAIGLALAERLARPDARWQGVVRLVFQPAEEGGRGALPMVEAGVLDDADWFLRRPPGLRTAVGLRRSPGDRLPVQHQADATFHGRGAHAAMGPELGRNALLAGSAAALNLYAISRHGGEHTLVNVGTMRAGSGRNVIADRCDMQLEVRGATDASLAYMESRAREVLAAAASMHGCTHETAVVGRTGGAEADPEAAALVAEVAARTPGVSRVVPSWPIGGGDDATFMARRVQERGGKACYFLIGSDIPAIHHACDFDVDESSLETGVALFERLVDQLLAV